MNRDRRDCILPALVFLLLASPVGAQYSNTIGLYSSASATSSELYSPALGSVQSIYFILSDPRAPGGAPIGAVQGFEFRVRAEVPAGAAIYYLSESIPAPHVNIGQPYGPVDRSYVVGFANPVPTVNRLVTLMTWQVLVVDITPPIYLYLEPGTPASVPGMLAFAYPVGDDLLLAGVTGTQPLFSLPEFAIGAHLAPPVATETTSFGGVKALFR